jgi:hypothetical protein
MNMALPLRPPQQVGIAGLGTLGKALACALDSGGLPGLALGAVTARDAALARHWMGAHLSHAVDCVDLDTLAEDKLRHFQPKFLGMFLGMYKLNTPRKWRICWVIGGA